MSRNVQIVILCEDRQHEAFARRFLERTGRNRRVQRVERAPGGRGSAEQFVRERYPKELAYYRERRHRVEHALIVLVDADRGSVDARVEQLERACQAAGMEHRQSADRVAIFVPARNIETWLAYLAGQSVNEEDGYPRLECERGCQCHVNELYKMCQAGALRQPAPSSLEAACKEYRSRLQP